MSDDDDGVMRLNMDEFNLTDDEIDHVNQTIRDVSNDMCDRFGEEKGHYALFHLFTTALNAMLQENAAHVYENLADHARERGWCGGAMERDENGIEDMYS